LTLKFHKKTHFNNNKGIMSGKNMYSLHTDTDTNNYPQNYATRAHT